MFLVSNFHQRHSSLASTNWRLPKCISSNLTSNIFNWHRSTIIICELWRGFPTSINWILPKELRHQRFYQVGVYSTAQVLINDDIVPHLLALISQWEYFINFKFKRWIYSGTLTCFYQWCRFTISQRNKLPWECSSLASNNVISSGSSLP